MIVTREKGKKYNSISLKTSFHIVNTICIHGSWKRLILTHWDSNANSFWAKTPWHFESHRPNHCWEIQSRFPWCFWLIKWSIHGETFRFLRSNLFGRHLGCVTMATFHHQYLFEIFPEIRLRPITLRHSKIYFVVCRWIIGIISSPVSPALSDSFRGYGISDIR